MPPVPLARPREVIRAFEKLGWSVVRRKGSHVMLSKTGQVAHFRCQIIRLWRAGHCVH
jgi:predicted RNA binding protein YcfA (HicA-like mRNA interferase family)